MSTTGPFFGRDLGTGRASEFLIYSRYSDVFHDAYGKGPGAISSRLTERLSGSPETTSLGTGSRGKRCIRGKSATVADIFCPVVAIEV